MRAAQGVLQFAHIAGPVVFFQRLDGAGSDGFRRALVFAGDFLQKIIHQQRNVLAPVAQRRNVDAHDVEPVKQILAKLLGGDGVLRGACCVAAMTRTST